MQAGHSKLHELLAPGVEAQGCELLGIQVSRGRRRTVLRLYIDREGGVSLDDCERVSHQVSGLLDVEDPIEGDYSLEVSSPGDDRPLFTRAHFERFIGHRVRVRMALPVAGQRNFTGELVAVDEGDQVKIRDGDEEWTLSIAQMSGARLSPRHAGTAGGDGEAGR